MKSVVSISGRTISPYFGNMVFLILITSFIQPSPYIPPMFFTMTPNLFPNIPKQISTVNLDTLLSLISTKTIPFMVMDKDSNYRLSFTIHSLFSDNRNPKFMFWFVFWRIVTFYTRYVC